MLFKIMITDDYLGVAVTLISYTLIASYIYIIEIDKLCYDLKVSSCKVLIIYKHYS